MVPFFYQTLPNLLNSFPKLFDQFQPSWNYVWWRVFGQLDKWEFNWHAKQEISGHIFPQTPRNQTSFLLIGGFLKPVSLHFLKALEHWLQQIATVLPILSDSQQPDAEGQLSGWTNLFLHIPYQNLFKAALPASACSLHCAATGIRKLWDMANCSEPWAGRAPRGWLQGGRVCPLLPPRLGHRDTTAGSASPGEHHTPTDRAHRAQRLSYVCATPSPETPFLPGLGGSKPTLTETPKKHFTPILQPHSSLLFSWLPYMFDMLRQSPKVANRTSESWERV